MINPKNILICGFIAIAIIALFVTFNILTKFTSNNGLAIQSTTHSVADSNRVGLKAKERKQMLVIMQKLQL